MVQTRQLLWIAVVVAMLAVLLNPEAASAAPGDDAITGSFFVDADFDGEIDPGEALGDTDPFYPEQGITATAYDSAGGSVVCVVTGGTPPTYSCDVATLGAGPFRLEYTFGVDDAADGWSGTFRGADSASNVQFAAAGDNVTFGAKPPAFCPPGASGEGTLFATCVVHGDRNSGGPQDVLVTTDYGLAGGPSSIAEKSTLGSVWGVAYDEYSGVLFTSAHLQRNVDHGVEGIDGLYWNDAATASAGTWNSVSLDNLGGPTFGVDPVRDLAAFDQPARDAEAYALAGKTGIGDIDITPGGRYLAAANLESKTINIYDLAPVRDGGAPAYDSAITLSNPGCPDTGNPDDWVPWAITAVSAEELYVGITCTAENSAVGGADLEVHVVSVSLATGTQGASLISVPMNYERGCVSGGASGCATDQGQFEPWTSDVNDANAGIGTQQPLLADIEIDSDGSLVLGFIDRSGLQHPDGGWEPVGPSENLRENPIGGELLRVCNVGGAFVVEGGGGCGLNFISPSAVGARDHHGGPGGTGEYYGDERWPRGSNSFHSETAGGGLYIHPLFDEVSVASMDANQWVSGGIAQYDNTTGVFNDAITLYRGRPEDGGYLGKGAGIGDIEGCWLPLEIGDYVWLDSNQDGIQDPNELALEGVTVNLRDSGGNLVATTVTGPDGGYSFNSFDGLEPQTDYVIQFDASTTTNLPAGLTPADLGVTDAVAGANGEIDSNAEIDAGGLGSGLPEIAYTTDVNGTVDHSLDAGFTPPANNRIGNLIWLDVDNNGAVDADEPGIEGLSVELYQDANGDGVFDPAVDTLVEAKVTDATGNYWFENLLEGATYFVAVPDDQTANTVQVNGLPIDPMTITSSTGGDLANNDIDNIDDGDPAPGFASVSGPIDVADGAELTAETDANTGTDAETYVEGAGGIDYNDADSNLTVDLGFTQASRIGNKVWLDGAEGDPGYNDGIAGADESANGIGNVTVELYADSTTGGTPGVYDPGIDLLVDTTTTDADGSYWFNSVAEATYFVAIPDGQTGQTVDGAAADLVDLVSSTAPTSDANAGIDDVDDGEPAPGFASISGPIDVMLGGSPTNENGDFEEGTDNGAETDINTKGSFFSDENSDLTIDFGFVEGPQFAIGNLVWVDTNDNGIADAGEPGIEGVTVNLLDADGMVIDTQITGADGSYLFSDLPAGDYQVSIPGGQTDQLVDGVAVDLADLLPSSNAVADPENNADNDSNGVEDAGAITSGTLTLGGPDPLVPTEPTDEVNRNGGDDDPGGTLPDEQRNFTVDFGFVQPLRVGNLVWLDDGGEAGGVYTAADEDDGQADPGEVGIEGVLVQLLDDTNTVIAETVTTADGNYWFDGLRAGDYSVGIPTNQVPVLDAQPGIIAGALDGLMSSTGQSAAGEDADDDDDGDPSGGFASLSAPFNLNYTEEADDENGDFAAGATGEAEIAADVGTGASTPDTNSNLEIDLGFSPTPTYRIGNLIWEDANDDGIAEPGEPGIPGLLVQLLDNTGAVVAETTTDADGHYSFDDLPAGDYQVRIPDDQTATLGGANGTDGLFDDYRTAGTPEPDADGDLDNDNNGVPDADGLTSGVVTLGGDPEPTNEDERSGAGIPDEDGSMPDDRSNLTVDFGLTPLYRIGNLVWEDYDNDGLAEDGEPGIQGVLVQLVDDTNTVVAETVTDADGKYEFAGLEAGDYQVRLPGSQAPELGAQAGIVDGALDGLTTSGTPETDANNGTDNDNNGVQDGLDLTSGVVSLGDGNGAAEPTGEELRDGDGTLDEDGAWPDNRSDLTVDFGLFRGLRLGNQIFLDGQQGDPGYNNGLFEVGEVGISGVEVELWIDDGDGVFDPAVDTQVDTTTTDADGNYLFEGLDPDVPYFVAVEDIGEGSATTAPVTGTPTDDDNDNDGAPVAGYDSVTAVVTLADPSTAPTSTGEQDTIPVGDDPAEDEANAAGDFYPDTNSELQVDLGFIEVPLYRIGNLVWEDLDNDGLAEVGEDGIADVIVELLDEAGDVIAMTVTDANGNYEFPTLVAGTYKVSIPMDQPALAGKESSNNGEDTDQNGLTGADNNDNGTILTDDAWTSEDIIIGADTAPFGTEPTDETLRADDLTTDDDPDGGFYGDDMSNYTVDFGFLDVPKYTIGNLIWVDENDNGVADPGEPGIGGVDVNLLDENGSVVQRTTTDADGTYLFEDLDAGEYQILIPAGQTGQTVDDGTNRPVDLQDLLSSSNEVPDPQDDSDNDTNGIPQDNATVTTGLLSVGLPDPLNPDEPVNEVNRNGGDDDDGGTTSDEQRNLTLDIGFVEPLRVGNLVWLDDGGASTDGYDATTEDDGIADPTEVGIRGVLVQLLDDSGTVVAETVTNNDGNYWFDGLRAGDYQIGIPEDQVADLGPQPAIVDGALDEVRSSTGISAAGEDADDDDDGNPDEAEGWASLSAVFNLDHNDEAADEAGDFGTGAGTEAEDDANDTRSTYVDTDSNLEIDFGFSPSPTYRLGNLVWEDFNNDGIADVGEPAIAGVLVQLLDDTGAVVAETVTDVDGHYEFTGLEAGDYQVNIPGDQAPELGDQPDIIAGALDGMKTSGTPNGADDESDNDNNGVENGDDFTSGIVELGEGTGNEEPTAEELRDADGTLDEDGALRDDRSELTVDFGFFRGLRLGNQVFLDGEQGDPGYNNGIFDTNETGISGVELELWEDDGDGVFDPATDTLIGTTMTDSEGNYAFGNLDPDTPYIVAIPEVSVGLASETVSSGPVDADNDNDGATVAGYASVSQPVVLAVGDTTQGETDTVPAGDEPADAEADALGDLYPDENSEMTVDFGFIDVPLYRIGNLVWDDVDNDGLAELGEDGIGGVTVQLLDSTGALFAETTTDADGKYEFPNLLPGEYSVSIPMDQDALSGFRSSDQGEEADPNNDADNNDNGIDAADAWTSGTILVGPDPVAIPFGSEPSDETLRVDDATDDDDDGGFYADDRSNYSVDFGFYKLALGSQVWLDTNADGILDDDETPIDGVPVILYEVADDGSLIQVDETITATIEDQPGSYVFEGLKDGTDYVVELPAEAFAEGGPLEGLYSSPDPAAGAPDPDDDPADSDDNGTDAAPGEAIRSAPVTMSAGDEPTGEPSLATGTADTNENLTVDFGVTALSLGGTLWEDANDNGVFEAPEEAPLAGVPVELWAVDPATGEVIGDAPIATTTTGPDGTYLFDGLLPGDYAVRVPASALQPGGPLTGLTSSTGSGIEAPDPDDDPTDGDDNGMLSPDGWVQTAPVSLDFGTEPEGEPESGPAGDANDNHTVDLGFAETPPMSLGNRVWADTDRSGVLDGDEEGIAEVVLELIDEATGEVIATTMTDAEGYYLFDDLEPGTYVVQIPASNFEPDGPLRGWTNVEVADATDPDDDPTDSDDQGTADADGVRSAPITLLNTFEPVGEADLGSVGSGSAADFDSNLTVDFGFVRGSRDQRPAPESVSGLFWFDSNDDGIVAEGEGPIEGVTVTLVDGSNGNLVAVAESDVNGFWEIKDLLPGEYRLVIDPANFEPGGPLFGLIDPDDLPAEGFLIIAGAEPGETLFGRTVDLVLRYASATTLPIANPVRPALAVTGGDRQFDQVFLSLLLLGAGSFFVGMGRARRRRD